MLLLWKEGGKYVVINITIEYKNANVNMVLDNIYNHYSNKTICMDNRKMFRKRNRKKYERIKKAVNKLLNF